MKPRTRFLLAVATLAALALLLSLLPAAPDRVASFLAHRLHDALARGAADAGIRQALDCSFHAADPAGAGLPAALRELGPLRETSGEGSDPCSVRLRTRGRHLEASVAIRGERAFVATVPRLSWTAVLPVLLAIGLAVATRRLLLALLAGVATGAALLSTPSSPLLWLPDTAAGTAGLLVGVLTDRFRFHIFLFTFALIGMVNVTTVSGGMSGLTRSLSRIARGARSTQAATALMGLAIFFDDYSNTIVVGSSMRALSDRAGIPREKLAYIVDSTAAPIAGLALVSTWIGYEVSLIAEALAELGLSRAPYAVFLSTLPYRFYCVLILALVGLNIWMGRELGPMAGARRRAQQTGELVRPGSAPLAGGTAPAVVGRPRAWSAVGPVLTVVLVTFLGMAANGAGLLTPSGIHPEAWASLAPGRLVSLENNYLTACTNGAWVLALAGLAGSAVAILLGILLGRAPLLRLVRAWFSVGRILLLAFSILVLAWSIGEVNRRLGTGAFLVSILADSVAPWTVPVLVFGLSAFVSFATGSSWGTMGVLLPTAVPLAYHVGGLPLMTLSVGAVLDGSIFGDHCSPLSDTTILSSVAAGCDHLDHVRTQIPYALTAAAVAVLAGYLPVTWVSPWVSYLAAGPLLWAALRVGGRTDAGGPAPTPGRG